MTIVPLLVAGAACLVDLPSLLFSCDFLCCVAVTLLLVLQPAIGF